MNILRRVLSTGTETSLCNTNDSNAAYLVTSKIAELYRWEKIAERFLKQADIIGSITTDARSSEYYITATTMEDRPLLSHKISPEMNARWSVKLITLTWNYTSRSSNPSSWSMKFKDLKDFKEIRDAYLGCLCKAVEASSLAKIGKVRSQVLDIEETDSEASESGIAGSLSHGRTSKGRAAETESDSDEDSEDSEPEQLEDDIIEFTTSKDKGINNSQLAVGHGEKNDRTFVSRGDKIGVFNHPDEGRMEYMATIKELKFKKMKSFEPKHMMLHDRDTKLILLNPLHESSLFAMDIEYGKITEEWKVDKTTTVKTVSPTSKYAQVSGEQTLVGISSNALFRMDPRVARRGGSVIVESIQYATQPKFSRVTTTTNGKLAVASEKGDIRLYDSVGKIAKSALPATVDAIIGMDVTGDGRWIVATCETYLLVIDTLISDGKYEGSLGFDHAFSAQSKPKPKRLQLRPEHVAQMKQNVSFTTARFNMGDGQENTIVTSTGRYIVVFDFAKIKKNKVDSYVIKRCNDEVVHNDFKFGNANEIIVALTNDVLSLDRRILGKSPL